MSKHTPGPWKVEPTLRPDWDDDPLGEYTVQPAADRLTERYFATDGDSPDNEYTAEIGTAQLDAIHAENAANARLIAAAPELLEACRIALEELNLWADTGADQEYSIGFLEAAIAKAEGGEQG